MTDRTIDEFAESRALRIGLTGGIASGKSTVAEMFRDLGTPIIDTDVIAREVIVPGTPGLREICDAFGDGVLTEEGELDRGKMRRIVFADAAKRQALEAILHPRIRAAAILAAEEVRFPYMIIVVPLLVESPMRNFMDRVLVVDVDVDTQIARLLQRDTETEQQARRIIAAQATRDERLQIADDVILNGDDLENTRKQVESLHQQYLNLSQISFT